MARLTHRKTEILDIARASGRVIVEDLVRRFEVSAQTIRKDLNDLCEQRSLTRIHGGAIIASGVENLADEAQAFCRRRRKESDRSGGECADPERLRALHQYRHHDRTGCECADLARGPALTLQDRFEPTMRMRLRPQPVLVAHDRAHPPCAASNRDTTLYLLAFVFVCDLVIVERRIANSEADAAGGSVCWTAFSTSQSLGAASMAAALRAMRRAAEIRFSSAK